MFKLYEQIAYVPNHAVKGSSRNMLSHPDIQFGFVMSIPKPNDNGTQDYFCRYWRKDELGELRTVANSERTSSNNIYRLSVNSRFRVPQEIVISTVMGILGIQPLK
jgi:hypothetical protein